MCTWLNTHAPALVANDGEATPDNNIISTIKFHFFLCSLCSAGPFASGAFGQTESHKNPLPLIWHGDLRWPLSQPSIQNQMCFKRTTAESPRQTFAISQGKHFNRWTFIGGSRSQLERMDGWPVIPFTIRHSLCKLCRRARCFASNGRQDIRSHLFGWLSCELIRFQTPRYSRVFPFRPTTWNLKS